MNTLKSSNSSALAVNPSTIPPSKVSELLAKHGFLKKGPTPPPRPVAVPVEKNGEEISADGPGVRSQWMEVTPEMAARWLKNNFGNRPMSEDTWKAYARDMLNNTWVPTHQGVAFNESDELIDGQHRLKAIVVSGCTVRMMVTFGLPSLIEGSRMTTMDAVDRGRTRSVADQLKIQHGIKNGSVTASICAALSSLCYGERTRRLSVGQTLEVLHEFEKAVDYVIEHKPKVHGLKSTGVLAGFAFALATEENFWECKTPISEMFSRVMTGEGLVPNTCSAQLRAFLTSDEAKLITRSLDRGLGEMVLNAIFLELQGKNEKLEVTLHGVNHFRSRQPERVQKIKEIFTLPKKEFTAAPEPVAQVTGSNAKPTLDSIVDRAAISFGLARILIMGKGSTPDMELARVAIALVAIRFGYSHPEIGKLLRRDTSQAQQKLNELFRSTDGHLFKTMMTRFVKGMGVSL